MSAADARAWAERLEDDARDADSCTESSRVLNDYRGGTRFDVEVNSDDARTLARLLRRAARIEEAARTAAKALARREEDCDSYCICIDGLEPDCSRCRWDEEQRELEAEARAALRAALEEVIE